MGINQHWSSKYVGLPYEILGRGPNGYDCWGLVCHIYRQELGIELPGFFGSYEDQGDSKAIVELYNNRGEDWVKVEQPQVLDVVMFNIHGLPVHTGVVVDPVEGTFIHAPENNWARIENYGDRIWVRRLEGFYRHV